VCDKAFSRPWLLRGHQRSHTPHLQQIDPPGGSTGPGGGVFCLLLTSFCRCRYRCSVCDKAFSRPWLLRGHQRSHTPHLHQTHPPRGSTTRGRNLLSTVDSLLSRAGTAARCATRRSLGRGCCVVTSARTAARNHSAARTAARPSPTAPTSAHTSRPTPPPRTTGVTLH